MNYFIKCYVYRVDLYVYMLRKLLFFKVIDIWDKLLLVVHKTSNTTTTVIEAHRM